MQFEESSRRNLIIKSRLKDYKVIIEKNSSFFEELTNKENAFYVISTTVYALYNPLFTSIKTDNLYTLSSTEENKTIDTVLNLCSRITQIPAKRNATLVSIGGGVIQDITGFVANIMYRGINWIFVPTTLLSACDSCIGGKTSLNYQKFKNLLGTFYPPNEIHIWSKMFQTLIDKDFRSGLGEVVKFNVMSGMENLFDIEQNIDSLINKEPATIDTFIEKSLTYKKQFIEVDEFDRGERIKLNFAHTFGHAIEVITEYEIPHGTAVAIGMIMANRISYRRGYIRDDIRERSEALLLKIIDINVQSLSEPLEFYLSAIRKDKKQIDDNITAVLITKFDKNSELNILHDIQNEEIEDAIQYFIELYKSKK